MYIKIENVLSDTNIKNTFAKKCMYNVNVLHHREENTIVNDDDDDDDDDDDNDDDDDDDDDEEEEEEEEEEDFAYKTVHRLCNVILFRFMPCFI